MDVAAQEHDVLDAFLDDMLEDRLAGVGISRPGIALVPALAVRRHDVGIGILVVMGSLAHVVGREHARRGDELRRVLAALLLLAQPGEQATELTGARLVDRRPAQQVIVVQPGLVVLEPLRAGIQHEERIAGALERVVEHPAVGARSMAPLVAHVGAHGEVEQAMLGILPEAVLAPVVLDLVIVEDHVGRRELQQGPHVARAEGRLVALLELFVGIGEAHRYEPV